MHQNRRERFKTNVFDFDSNPKVPFSLRLIGYQAFFDPYRYRFFPPRSKSELFSTSSFPIDKCRYFSTTLSVGLRSQKLVPTCLLVDFAFVTSNAATTYRVGIIHVRYSYRIIRYCTLLSLSYTHWTTFHG